VPRQSGRPGAFHVAAIVAPVIRNKLVLGIPTARAATRLTQFGASLLRELVARYYRVPSPGGSA
jgi:LysR family transcriptional regulator, nitrogen assimilation regulatory protein